MASIAQRTPSRSVYGLNLRRGGGTRRPPHRLGFEGRNAAALGLGERKRNRESSPGRMTSGVALSLQAGAR